MSSDGERTKQIVDCIVAGLSYRNLMEEEVPCEPVRIIVFFRLSIMNERILAVKLIVSVPCKIMKASNST